MSKKIPSPTVRSFTLQPAPVPFSPLHKSKVIMLGDSGAGKTSLLKRMLEDKFPEGPQPTIGVDFLSKTVKKNGKPVRLQVWDSAGQERFNSLVPGYVRSAKLAVIVFDLSKEGALESTDRWVEMVKTCKTEDTVIILVGNKADVVNARVVSEDAAVEKAKGLNVPYKEVSAKSGAQVKDLLNLIIEMVEPVHHSKGGAGESGSENDDQSTCYQAMEKKISQQCCIVS